MTAPSLPAPTSADLLPAYERSLARLADFEELVGNEPRPARRAELTAELRSAKSRSNALWSAVSHLREVEKRDATVGEQHRALKAAVEALECQAAATRDEKEAARLLKLAADARTGIPDLMGFADLTFKPPAALVGKLIDAGLHPELLATLAPLDHLALLVADDAARRERIIERIRPVLDEIETSEAEKSATATQGKRDTAA